MRLTSPAFKDNEPIPENYAFGVPDDLEHMRLGENRNPPLAWSALPALLKEADRGLARRIGMPPRRD